MAVAIAAPATVLLAPIPGGAATIIGVALGGFVAGKWADSAGLYHGALVAAGWIALEAFGIVPTLTYSNDALGDTLLVFVIDLVTLLAGSFGGWRARPGPSSSSGMDKDR